MFVAQWDSWCQDKLVSRQERFFAHHWLLFWPSWLTVNSGANSSIEGAFLFSAAWLLLASWSEQPGMGLSI